MLQLRLHAKFRSTQKPTFVLRQTQFFGVVLSLGLFVLLGCESKVDVAKAPKAKPHSPVTLVVREPATAIILEPIVPQPEPSTGTEPPAEKTDTKAATAPGPVKNTEGPEFTDAQLHKNLTTLMLAYQPDMRARDLMKYLRQFLTPEQQALGLDLLLDQDHHYQEIIARRSDILNAAVAGDDTPEKLRKIRIETVQLSAKMRLLVFTALLTEEQKRLRKIWLDERSLANKIELEERQKR